MKPVTVAFVVFSLLFLGCYSTPSIIGGGEAAVITGSKNFTMKEGWQDSFSLSGSSNTYSITVSSVASKAAMLKIGGRSVILDLGETSNISLDDKTVTITVYDISDGYVKFAISVPQSTTQQQGGQQNNTQQGGQLPNGAACSNDSVCQSAHCSNGYCCASGSCCVSDSGCSIGKCNMTTYSCFAATFLSDGLPCNSNTDCQSNYCNSGYCCASGKCCLTTSNCASGQACNITSHSCIQTAPTYTANDAEQLASSTMAGQLMTRFSTIFETARQCPGGSAAYKQCVPIITTRADKISSSTFIVTYLYSFNGTGCCTNTDVLTITTDLTANTATDHWLDTTITSSLADSMDSSLGTNCVSAIQYIACKTS